jgi:hypothetical protein
LPASHPRIKVRCGSACLGTGFASLTDLRKLPFDRIQIDRSFIGSIDQKGTAAIVSMIVRMSCGRSITAEGVETAHQLELVVATGCVEVRRFFFCRPVSEREAGRLCADPPAAWQRPVGRLIVPDIRRIALASCSIPRRLRGVPDVRPLRGIGGAGKCVLVGEPRTPWRLSGHVAGR